jgi:uncharacterized protein (DUF488 family)
MNRRLFSIGHSNHPIEHFLGLLKQHGIEVLVDVRSQPFSKYATQFNVEAIRESLRQADIKYLFLGKELGGRPDGTEFYDDEGHVNYARVAQADFFLKGLERLEKGAEQFRVAMMCSEEDPACCHRFLLTTRVLEKRGVEVQHIRGDGAVNATNEIEAGDQPASDEHQLDLFAERKAPPWRSIKPILMKPGERGA